MINIKLLHFTVTACSAALLQGKFMTPKQSSLCYLTFHQPMQKSLNAVIMKGVYSIKICTSSISLYLTEKGKSYLSILIKKKIIGNIKQIILFFEGGGGHTFRGCISSGPSSRYTQNSVQFLAPYNAFYSFQDLVFLVKPWLAWFNHNICICLFIWHQINGSNPL